MITFYAEDPFFKGHWAVSDCLKWFIKRQTIGGQAAYCIEYDDGRQSNHERYTIRASNLNDLCRKVAAIARVEHVALFQHDENGQHKPIASWRQPDLFSGVAA